jgi:hypothetical protein
MLTNPTVRRALGTVLAVVIAAAGVIGLIAFFESRDESTTGGTAKAPEQLNAGSVLREGNVVLTYSDPAFKAPLRDFAEQNGPDTPVLRAAGGSVIVRHNATAQGVVARSFSATLQAQSPDDPKLQDFVDRWLGEGAPG